MRNSGRSGFIPFEIRPPAKAGGRQSRQYRRDLSRTGFTLFEMLLFTAIFAVATGVMVMVLIAVTRVEVRQSAAVEVSTQSQLLLQTIQQAVERSAMVELPTDLSTSTLKLRMAATSTGDPTYIYLAGAAVYLRETDAGSPQQLTSDRVAVNDLTFVKRANSRGKDSVAVNFSISYNTSNLQRRFTQVLDTGVARVSAATFDSDIRASTTNFYKIGAAASEWQSINNTIYFSGSNVGIGIAGPAQKLHVSGGTYLDGPVGIGTSTPTASLLSVGTSTSALVAVFGGGSGKINAGTIDPIYTIDGKQYATYLPSMTGVREETTGVVRLTCSPVSDRCSAQIDLDAAPVGSDLWLFAKTTRIKENFDRLTVLISPGFDGRVWYSKDRKNYRLFVYGVRAGAEPAEISYRLSAPRFDAERWPNEAPPGGGDGFVIDD